MNIIIFTGSEEIHNMSVMFREYKRRETAMFLHSRILCSSSPWTETIPDIMMVEAEVEIGVGAEIGVEVWVEIGEVEAEVRVGAGEEGVGRGETVTGDLPHIEDLIPEKEGTLRGMMMIEVEVRLLRRKVQVIECSL
jgi:hypothetical protein